MENPILVLVTCYKYILYNDEMKTPLPSHKETLSKQGSLWCSTNGFCRGRYITKYKYSLRHMLRSFYNRRKTTYMYMLCSTFYFGLNLFDIHVHIQFINHMLFLCTNVWLQYNVWLIYHAIIESCIQNK